MRITLLQMQKLRFDLGGKTDDLIRYWSSAASISSTVRRWSTSNPICRLPKRCPTRTPVRITLLQMQKLRFDLGGKTDDLIRLRCLLRVAGVVSFTAEVETQLLHLEKRYPHLKAFIREVLAQDPRPR
jgi:hypothetical protein